MLRVQFARVVAICGLIAAAGCNETTAPTARSELEANRAKWTQAALGKYEFTFRQLCFCGFTEPVRVTVNRDGTIASAFTVANHTAVDVRFVKTIEGLFDFIGHALDAGNAIVHVTYHPTSGYPLEITYDIPHAVDDEVTYTVSDLFLADLAVR